MIEAFHEFPAYTQFAIIWAILMLGLFVFHELICWVCCLKPTIPLLSDDQKYKIRKLKTCFHRWYYKERPPYGGQPGFYKCACVKEKWVFLKKLEWADFNCSRCYGSGCD